MCKMGQTVVFIGVFCGLVVASPQLNAQDDRDGESFLWNTEGGDLPELTLEELDEDGPRSASCLFYSSSLGRLVCIEPHVELPGRVYEPAIVDLASGFIASDRFVMRERPCREDSPDCLVSERRLLSHINELIDDADDWVPTTAVFSIDLTDEHEHPDVDLGGGVVLSLSGETLLAIAGGNVISQLSVDGSAAGPERIRVYRPNSSPVAVVATTSRTEGYEAVISDLRLLRLGEIANVEPVSLTCPAEAGCSANHNQLYPLLDSFCREDFAEAEFAALGELLSSGLLNADDLVRLYNTYGALTGYRFARLVELNSFYYGEGVGGLEATVWLPDSCRTVIGNPQPELSTGFTVIRDHIKRLNDVVEAFEE